MLLVVLNWFIYLAVVQYVLSAPLQTSYYIFFPINYLAFEYTHLLSHSYVGNNNIILNAKQYHRQHHFTPEMNYSFVTPFWDYWLGTLHPEYDISFSELLLGFLPFYSFMIHSAKICKRV
jgi:sterol desaturase/sphingolipid hydroxylase (fatty acid hydroxylase superfamily)